MDTVGATSCVRLGNWVANRCSPRPTAAFPGKAVDGAPMPASAVAPSGLTVVGWAVDAPAIAPAPVAVIESDDPTAAGPVADMEVLLSVSVLVG